MWLQNESAMWAKKGKQGNLWEARQEEGPALIGYQLPQHTTLAGR
jgi:hypothetical protein